MRLSGRQLVAIMTAILYGRTEDDGGNDLGRAALALAATESILEALTNAGYTE